MRRILKQQVLEITRLLDQIHDGIRIKLQASQKEEILRLLEQCQDAAINIGEAIEQEEGEDFVTVTYLEEYCETVYRIYEQVLCGQTADPSKIYKKLRKDLIQIENSIKKDIKVHIELLFLPYKASMWDSLESIWKAADSDLTAGHASYLFLIMKKLPTAPLAKCMTNKICTLTTYLS